jgi:hypothetical protein
MSILPQGPYRNQCINCFTSGDNLICQCPLVIDNKTYNVWPYNSISNCPNIITTIHPYLNMDNINGVLTCNTNNKPNYSSTCYNCRVNNNILSCNCRNYQGSLNSTSKKISDCTPSGICRNCMKYENGQLKCGI